MHARTRLLLTGLALAFLLLVVGVAVLGFDGARELLQAGWARLQSAPAPIFFAAVTLLLALPVPASLMHVAAGTLYSVEIAIAGATLALATNALLVHVIGTTSLRPLLEEIVEGRGYRLPRLRARASQLAFIFVTRATPGPPYFLQSWALVLAGVDRLPFVLVTTAIHSLYATGFIVLGRSAFEGRLGLVGAAVAFLVLLGLVMRRVLARLRREAAAKVQDV